MYLDDLMNLLVQLQDNKFWGRVELKFKSGRVAIIEVSQTIKTTIDGNESSDASSKQSGRDENSSASDHHVLFSINKR